MANLDSTAGLNDTKSGPSTAVDEELLALEAPPGGRRLAALTFMAMVVAAAIALVLTLRTDIAYFFARPQAADLGNVRSLHVASLTPNTFVRIEGIPMYARTVRYTRSFTGTRYAVFPLAGQRDIFVQVEAGSEDVERQVVRREFAGRLVTFGQLGGRFGPVRGYLERTMKIPVSSESFLLLTNETPQSYAWSLLLAGLCALIILVDALLIVRWFRPLR